MLLRLEYAIMTKTPQNMHLHFQKIRALGHDTTQLALSYSRRLALNAKTRLHLTVLCLCIEQRQTTVVSIHISIKECLSFATKQS
jgi:hypothetical protein